MITLQVAGKFYQIEFRHLTKFGKRHELGDKSPVKAITTCVVAAGGLVAIDSVVCSDEDNFSRRRGRDLAFDKVLARCTALRAVRTGLIDEYIRVVGVPPSLLKAPRKAKKLSADERQRRIDDGRELRERRLNASLAL